MKLCFPADTNQGLSSPVCTHFGGAPHFLIVDSESLAVTPVQNANVHAGGGHGACQPLNALGGHDVDAIVVGGIGMGAMMKLAAAGIRVYRAEAGTVGDNVNRFLAGTLLEVDVRRTCEGHGGHGSCSHH